MVEEKKKEIVLMKVLGFKFNNLIACLAVISLFFH